MAESGALAQRATMFNDLPLDLRSNVLSRLGVKEVMRLKCVNHQWGDMIEEKDFAKLQSRNGLTVHEVK